MKKWLKKKPQNDYTIDAQAYYMCLRYQLSLKSEQETTWFRLDQLRLNDERTTPQFEYSLEL